MYELGEQKLYLYKHVHAHLLLAFKIKGLHGLHVHYVH